MSDKINFKAWLWEMTPKGEDNVKHQSFSSVVDLISVPIEENKLSISDEGKHPASLDLLMSKLEFKGNIRLSASGKSYNLFRDKLEDTADDTLVTLQIQPTI